MKAILFALLIIVASPLWAQYRPLETTDEARQRHNAERYETYRQRGYEAPTGGYRERLGDPAPRGTESPGYTAPRRGDPYAPQINDRKRY